MKRTVLLSSIVFVGIAVTAVTFAQSDASAVCPFNITGLWRSDSATEITRMFFSFSPEGHVTLLGYSPDTLPQDFETITSVDYKLDKSVAPNEIEFTAWRGNDVFQKGVTSWKIVQYGDDSFITMDPVSGQQTRWFREQTHRYFLTFAAAGGPPMQGGPAFAVWTVMDGRQTMTEALGVQIIRNEAGKIVPTFGRISAELYDRIIEESEADKKGIKQEETVIARFELTQSEFETTRKIFEIWDNYATKRTLPYDDPYLNEMEFLGRAVEGFNQCGDRVKMNRPTRRERDEVASKFNPPRQPLEYIRITRKKNEDLHVTNSMYPWIWRPLIQQPEH